MSVMVGPVGRSLCFPSSSPSKSADGVALQRLPSVRSSRAAKPVADPMHRVSEKKMGQLSQKKSTDVGSDRTTVAERVVAFLRTRHPHKMAECVAAETGINAGTIRKLEERLSAPSLAVFGRLGCAYGPEFLHAVFGWDWLDRDVRENKLRELESRRAQLDEQLNALRAQLR